MTAALRAITLTMPGDVRICVPAALDIMATYCILEQDDWFEKEMGFVRRLLTPGMTVIDIGANYGVYSLTAARAVGTEGAVWAFEPASGVLPYLREGVARNGFGQVHVIDAALADSEGQGHLRLAHDPGLNQLQAPGSGPGESVRVTTLDHQQAAFGTGEIDFVKLDAEGAERSILSGGRQFLATRSPLVMFERIHNGMVDDGIAEDFRAMGWGIYRLPSADGYLVPLEPGEAVDPLELNLFTCKRARAVGLSERGLLALDPGPGAEIARGGGLALLEKQAFWPRLSPRLAPGGDPSYGDALDALATARDQRRGLGERWSALRRAVERARELLRGPVTPAKCATSARIAFEAGERVLAAQALHAIIRAFPNHRAEVGEPLWPPAPRYDAIDPGPDLDAWFNAAVIEQYERLRSYSSHLSGRDTLALLDWLQSTPFASHEMERRRLLIRLAHQLEAKRTPFLEAGAAACLNREAWLPSGSIGALLKP